MAAVMIIGSGTAATQVAKLLADTECLVVTGPHGYSEAPSCCDIEVIDELKSNMNFYQTKMHRRKKGGKVSFR